MRRRVHLAVVVATAAGLAAPAFADPPHHPKGRYYDRHWGDGPRHYDRYDRYDRRGHDERYDRDERHAYRDGYRDGYRNDHYRDRYAYSYSYRWRPGYYLPDYNRYRRIHDYYSYRLPEPRHGHYYVDCDGEILLIAAATGLIVWALNN